MSLFKTKLPKVPLLLAALILICIFPWRLSATEEILSYGRIGTVHLYYRSDRPSRVAIFISGDAGWKLGVIDMSRELAATQDALVIGIDIISYLQKLDAAPDDCSYAVDDFSGLADMVEKRLGYRSYVAPSLVGYSSGATLVYGLMVQAKPDTFVGAVSLGFCPDLQNRKIFCKGEGLESKKNPKAPGYLFQIATNLKNPWVALQGTVDKICSPPDTYRFVREVPHGRIVMLPRVGHGFSRPRNWMPQLKAAFKSIYVRGSDGVKE